MICKPCRDAGNLLVAVDLSYDFTDEGDIQDAEDLHSECRDGTWCDCAHKTEAVIRK